MPVNLIELPRDPLVPMAPPPAIITVLSSSASVVDAVIASVCAAVVPASPKVMVCAVSDAAFSLPMRGTGYACS